ncbi:diguanylate cyclase [Pseudomonas sp. M30-35]|uniref:sensor domain-containing diguanylate cyclase n=1 Tax=Pseudomonas sp. M30-35 TaxID=1981174 RepID=UPI000B3BF71B|nr:diguanylate cyclase [Pseudomonas sp. M30-35]ARU90320.1 sensor domain-containing diguanylate cyclase [Pseudomonas sp. M30-35]
MAQRLPQTWIARFALAVLLSGLYFASLTVWQQMVQDQQQSIAERVSSQAKNLATRLQNNLDYQVHDLYRVAQLWNQRGRIPKDQWLLESQFSLEHFKAYQSIQWLGPDLHMRWVAPITGNEAALNFVLKPDHPNYSLALHARDTGTPQFSNSFALVQGGRGFVLYTPLYIKNEQGKRVFDGFLQGVFKVEPLMDQLLSEVDRDYFSADLLENGKPIYSREQPDTKAEFEQKIAFHLLDNQSFAITLKPSPKLLARLHSPLPTFVLCASLIISTLLVAALALALQSHQRANDLQNSNQRLNKEIAQREHIEHVLIESRERLQLVIDMTDSSSDGLFIVNPDSREIIYMNRATYRSLGYSAEEFSDLFKQNPDHLLPNFTNWLSELRKSQDSSPSQMSQHQLLRRDGSTQPAEISAQLVVINEHEYLICVSRDNSERLRFEAQLKTLSQQDGLTGLFNRRYFDNQLESEWRRLQRSGSPLTLMMLDIDYFKAYNDQRGHLAGDDALRHVAKIMQDCLHRQGDSAYRYGGEEFAIILANTGAEGAAHIAAQLHQKLDEARIRHLSSPFGRLTLSIGIASINADNEDLPDSLIERSDQALYQAKHEGRNRTCLARPVS